MNEPWELNDHIPDSVKKMDEIGKSEDEGHKITVSKTWKVNWDDWLERAWNKIFKRGAE